MKRFSLLFFLLAATPITPLWAGVASSQPSQQSGSTLSAEAREDIGDIRPLDEIPWTAYFYGNAQIQGEYTANARLLGNEGSSDYLWMPTLTGGFNVPLGQKFTLQTAARMETIAYSKHQDLGFFGFSGDVTLDYQPKPELPHFYVGMQPYYYWGFDTSDRVGEAIAFSGGVTDSRFIYRGKTMIFGGYNFSSYVSSPSLDNRDSHRALIGVTQQIKPALYAQLYYAFQFTNYLDQDRRDARHMLGLNMVYQFSEKLFGSVNGTFINNHSTNSLATYQNLAFGTGLTYQF